MNFWMRVLCLTSFFPIKVFAIIEGWETSLAPHFYSQQLEISSVRVGTASVDNEGQITGDFTSHCSGTISSLNQITTAAHCFRGLFPGSRYFAEVTLPGGERRLIPLNEINSRYNLQDLFNILAQSFITPRVRFADMVILTLSESLSPEHIINVCTEPVTAEGEFVVAGFGVDRAEMTMADLSSQPLRHARVDIEVVESGMVLSRENRFQGRAHGIPSDEGHNSTACYGDSGGGLFMINSYEETLCLAGIVSGGYPEHLESCGAPDKKQVFSRVSLEQVNQLMFTVNVASPPSLFGETMPHPELPRIEKPRESWLELLGRVDNFF